MLTCCGRSSRHEGNNEARGREPDDEERNTPNELNLQQVHAIIRQTATREEKGKRGNQRATDIDENVVDADSTSLSRNVMGGVRLTGALWGLDSVDWQAGTADTSGAFVENGPNALNAGKRQQAPIKAIPGKAFHRLTAISAERWLRKVQREERKPQGP